MKHVDFGARCLVAHYKDGVLQPPCMICANCGHVPWGEYESECVYTGEDPSTCDHVWKVISYYLGRSQEEQCVKCHIRETVPASDKYGTLFPRN